jgi:membrane protein DedA with SNARE-associated domain
MPIIERGKPPAIWVVRVMLVIVAISIVTQLVGDAIAPDLVNRAPEWLVILNPRSRNLVLATTQLSAVTFYGLAFTRLVLTDPIYYLLGYWYGDKALAWTKRRSRTYGPLVDDGAEFFRKAAYPIIFFVPNNVVCLLTGATGMRVPVFVALNVAGTITRLVLIRSFGSAFQGQIGSLLDLIREYRIPLLILAGLSVLWTVFWEFRGNNSELQGLRDLTADGDGSDRGSTDGDRADGGVADSGGSADAEGSAQ